MAARKQTSNFPDQFTSVFLSSIQTIKQRIIIKIKTIKNSEYKTIKIKIKTQR